MTITNKLARNTLFGSGVKNNKHNLVKSLTTDSIGLCWAILNSEYKHSFTSGKALVGASMALTEYSVQWFDSLFRSPDKLERGFDKKLFSLVDEQLRKHLSSDVANPKFFAMAKGSYATPISWVIKVGFTIPSPICWIAASGRIGLNAPEVRLERCMGFAGPNLNGSQQ